MRGKLIKVCKCSNCRRQAVIYQQDIRNRVYTMYCFACDTRKVGIDPLQYPDVFKQALLAVVDRLRYKKEDIPETADWRDIQISLLGMIDVRNLELFNLRKFFTRNAGKENEQLNFYHLLKRRSDKEARIR